MNPRFALAAVLVTSAALAACGWLLPDGELEAAASDAGTQVEDSAAADTWSVVLDSGTTEDDTGTIVDPGDPKWGEPELLREPDDGGTIVLRPGTDGEVYFSLVSATTDDGRIFYAPSANAAATRIMVNGIPLIGNSPAPFAIGGFTGIFYVRDGWIVSRLFSDAAVVSDPPDYRFEAGPPADPSLAIGACYFGTTDQKKLYRGNLADRSFVELTIRSRETGTSFSKFRAPVPTADEQILYYGYGEGTDVRIWVARRSKQLGSPDFEDAHPIVFSGSSAPSIPTAVSADGKELFFTRFGAGTSASYLVKQL